MAQKLLIKCDEIDCRWIKKPEPGSEETKPLREDPSFDPVFMKVWKPKNCPKKRVFISLSQHAINAFVLHFNIRLNCYLLHFVIFIRWCWLNKGFVCTSSINLKNKCQINLDNFCNFNITFYVFFNFVWLSFKLKAKLLKINC